MREKTGNGANSGQTTGPEELDIPAGRTAGIQDDFVAAVEQRSAEVRDDPGAAPLAPRRRGRWLATVIGIVVLAIVVVGLVLFTDIGRQSGDAERVTGSLVPSDNSSVADQNQADGETSQDAETAGDATGETEVLADVVTEDESVEPAAQSEEQATTSDAGVDEVEPEVLAEPVAEEVEAVDTESVSELPEVSSDIEFEIPEELDLPEIEAPLEPIGEAEPDVSVSDIEVDVEPASEATETIAEVPPEPTESPSTTTVEEPTPSIDEATEADLPETAQPAAEIPVIAAGQSDGNRVQLASYGTEERAQAAWTEFEADLADILGDHVPMIEEAILDSGTFYRLQIASFATAVDARDFCAQVLERRLECIVVPR